jgi:heterodisulfide reductase subunit B
LIYSDKQEEINKRFRKRNNIPVFLYPQLLGLALGGNPITELGFDLNAISLDKLLANAGGDKQV